MQQSFTIGGETEFGHSCTNFYLYFVSYWWVEVIGSECPSTSSLLCLKLRSQQKPLNSKVKILAYKAVSAKRNIVWKPTASVTVLTLRCGLDSRL